MRKHQARLPNLTLFNNDEYLRERMNLLEEVVPPLGKLEVSSGFWEPVLMGPERKTH